MRIAKAITLTDKDSALTKWSRGRSTPARLILVEDCSGRGRRS